MANGDDWADVKPKGSTAASDGEWEDVAPKKKASTGIAPEPWYQRLPRLALRSAGLPETISDIPAWGQRLIGQEPGQPWRLGDPNNPISKAIKEPTQRNVVGAVPILGPTAVAAADEPTLSGKLAILAGGTLPFKGLGQVGPGLRAGKVELAETTRTPEQALTPSVKATSRAVGGLTGGAAGMALGKSLGNAGVLGEGYLGYRTGEALGPVVADKLLPLRPETKSNFFGGAYSDYADLPAGASQKVSSGPGLYTGPPRSIKPLRPVAGPATPTPSQWEASRQPPVDETLAGQPTFGPESKTSRLGTGGGEGLREDSDVSVFPEPREPLPGDRPGAMWSVGREEVLPESAGRGAPGAGDVLRNIGKPIIYTPREGVGYPGPRRLGETPSEPPQGNSSPGVPNAQKPRTPSGTTFGTSESPATPSTPNPETEPAQFGTAKAPESRRPLPGETPERRGAVRDAVNDISVEQLRRDLGKPGLSGADRARIQRNIDDLMEMRQGTFGAK
jgi:hypothetical protein